MTPKKPEWFELTDSAKASDGIQKVNRKLSIGTLVAAGAIILGGSVFATTQNEPSAVANTPAASQSMAAAQSNSPAISNSANSAPAPTVPVAKSSTGFNSLPVPKVTAAPQRSERGEGSERDHKDREDD
jgi:hypothetical protein